jgi:hypothetical protein
MEIRSVDIVAPRTEKNVVSNDRLVAYRDRVQGVEKSLADAAIHPDSDVGQMGKARLATDVAGSGAMQTSASESRKAQVVAAEPEQADD